MPKISKFCVEKGYLVYVRAHQQITFSTLNRFCQFISKTLPPTQFLTDIIMLDGLPSKIKWKYTFFLHCISSFEGTSHICFIIQSPGLLVLIVLHQFLHQQMSFFTTFYNFIQHYLKQDFLWMFLLSTGSLNHPPPTSL